MEGRLVERDVVQYDDVPPGFQLGNESPLNESRMELLRDRSLAGGGSDRATRVDHADSAEVLASHWSRNRDAPAAETQVEPPSLSRAIADLVEDPETPAPSGAVAPSEAPSCAPRRLFICAASRTEPLFSAEPEPLQRFLGFIIEAMVPEPGIELG